MSTVSGAESVKFNPSPRRLRPGRGGRRRVVTCRYGHLVPERERFVLPWPSDPLFPGWRCRECGTRWREWNWFCAPVLQEAREWLVWGWRKLRELHT